MSDPYKWPFQNDSATVLRHYHRAVRRGRAPRVLRWNPLDDRGPGRWLRHLVYEPRDFAFAAPRRMACRLLGRHNITCHRLTSCRRHGYRAVPAAVTRVTLQPGEYLLPRAVVARLAAPLPPQTHGCGYGCSSDTCCTCGEDPCCTS
ncbi:hypothetical protein ACFWCB_26305 [Streptomyces sp. NPDC060048]|uniref:hypothetical protein n=1 Tax=unclassified Streptomyces TaxID=2593676 RepID=UPI0036CB9668